MSKEIASNVSLIHSTKYNTSFPSNCLPISNKKLIPIHQINQLLEMNRSITQLLEKQHQYQVANQFFVNFHRSKSTFEDQHSHHLQHHSLLFDNEAKSKKRIHHNLIEFNSISARKHNQKYQHHLNFQTKTKSIECFNRDHQKNAIASNNDNFTRKTSKKQEVLNQEEDIFEKQIDIYMNKHLNQDDLVEKYMENKEAFILEACQQIKNKIKKKQKKISARNIITNANPDEGLIRKNDLKKHYRKQKSLILPSMLAQSPTLNGLQSRNKFLLTNQINQLKKIQRLDIKHRKRAEVLFHKKMVCLHADIERIKAEQLK